MSLLGIQNNQAKYNYIPMLQYWDINRTIQIFFDSVLYPMYYIHMEKLLLKSLFEGKLMNH